MADLKLWIQNSRGRIQNWPKMPPKIKNLYFGSMQKRAIRHLLFIQIRVLRHSQLRSGGHFELWWLFWIMEAILDYGGHLGLWHPKTASLEFVLDRVICTVYTTHCRPVPASHISMILSKKWQVGDTCTQSIPAEMMVLLSTHGPALVICARHFYFI